MLNSSLDISFNIYKLANPKSVFGYSHVGISNLTERVIFICKDHFLIETVHENDKSSFESDYVTTNKRFNFDLAFLDDLIESYIKQRNYSIIVYYWPQKKVALTYRTSDTNKYVEKDLDSDLSIDNKTNELALHIYELFESIKV